MNKNSFAWSNVISLALLLGSTSSVLAATETQISRSTIHKIEQPLSVKVSVTLGGLGLIGLELWWFLFSQKKASDRSNK